MIAFNRRTMIFVSKEPSDMRASYDTLFLKTKTILDQDPFSGHLFVFMNARRTSCKCLFYDDTGLVLICKRLGSSASKRMSGRKFVRSCLPDLKKLLKKDQHQVGSS